MTPVLDWTYEGGPRELYIIIHHIDNDQQAVGLMQKLQEVIDNADQ